MKVAASVAVVYAAVLTSICIHSAKPLPYWEDDLERELKDSIVIASPGEESEAALLRKL